MDSYEDTAEVRIDLGERLKHMNKIDALLEKERLRLADARFEGIAAGSDGGDITVIVSGNGDVVDVKVGAKVSNHEIGKLLKVAAAEAQMEARAAAEKSFSLIAKRVVDADPVKLLADEK